MVIYMIKRIRRSLCFSCLLILTAGAIASDRVEYLNSGDVLPNELPFSEAVRVGETLYLSGQLGVKPGTMELASGGMTGQTRQTMENIKATLNAYGYSMSELVKCTIMLADISRWAEFNAVYVTFFEPPFPARSAFGANGLALGAEVEVECIAVKQE